MSTNMDTYTSLMTAKSDPSLVGYHALKTSKTTPSVNDFQDFDYYSRQPSTSPSVRVYHQDKKLIESSSTAVDFRVLMENINAVQKNAQVKQESSREKLQNHWTEVAGRVCVPEKWDQEKFLNDWMDYSLFDSLLAPNGVVSARDALIAERQKENSRCPKMADRSGEQVLSFLT